MADMRDFYEGYYAWRKEAGHLYKDGPPKRVQIAVDMVAASVGDSDINILDVGCGEGSMGKVLRERLGQKAHIVGADISEQALELASAHYDELHNLDFENDDWNMILGKRNFDVVICLEVLEHLFDPKGLLERLASGTPSTTQFILSFPNFAFYRYRLEVLKGNFPEEQHIYSDIEHLHYFTISSFEQLLKEAGLKMMVIDGEFQAPSWFDILPSQWVQSFMRSHPALFGIQLVIKATKG